MPRYANADKLKTDILAKYKKHWEVPCSSEDRLIQSIVTDLRVLIEKNTTADVAPRAEVAREIFEEIESLFPSDKKFTTISRVTINRLKKKYAEGEDTNIPTKKDYYTPEEVRNMSHAEISNNLTVIRKSMKRWRKK